MNEDNLRWPPNVFGCVSFFPDFSNRINKPSNRKLVILLPTLVEATATNPNLLCAFSVI